jgi:hypothetical protein
MILYLIALKKFLFRIRTGLNPYHDPLLPSLAPGSDPNLGSQIERDPCRFRSGSWSVFAITQKMNVYSYSKYSLHLDNTIGYVGTKAILIGLDQVSL